MNIRKEKKNQVGIERHPPTSLRHIPTKSNAFTNILATALSEALELVPDTICESGGDTFTNDVDTVEEDTKGVIDWHEAAVALSDHGCTLALAEVANDHWVVGCEVVDGELLLSSSREAIGRRRVNVVVDKTVSPENETDTVNGTCPPTRTDAARHEADVTDNLTTVEDGFLNIGNGTLVAPCEVLVRVLRIHFLTSGEFLNLRKVGNCVERDKVEDDQGCLHKRAERIGLHVAIGEGEPALEESLYFFQAKAGGGSSEGRV